MLSYLEPFFGIPGMLILIYNVVVKSLDAGSLLPGSTSGSYECYFCDFRQIRRTVPTW